MKDGTVQTNPGFLNPNVVRPVGPTDPQSWCALREDEKHNPIMTWVNYAMHLDTVGGTWISSDYAYYLARTLAEVKGADMLTTFTIGAAGDINHWDVQRPGPQRGFETAQKLGEALAADVVKAYTHLQALDSVRVKAVSETILFPLHEITDQEVKRPKKSLLSLLLWVWTSLWTELRLRRLCMFMSGRGKSSGGNTGFDRWTGRLRGHPW